ncbi:MAG: DUF4465 domain-containing protein [Bacteroidales bacterium]|nr:DUF4465 domain-containing protein [Bacteroidales bacterium]
MKQMYLLVATFLCCSMSLLAQRPENVYAIQALQGNKNAVSTASKKTAPAVSRSSSQSASRSCADCYLVDFEISSDSLIEIYDEAEIWNHTYEFNDPINNYKGFWDYEEACMTFMHYADTTWSSMAYWDGFTISNTRYFDCDTACSSSCTDFHNQFAAMPKDGAKRRTADKYAVAYDGYNEFFFQERHCNITLSQDDSICGLFLTLNAYTYKSIKCGDDFAGAFEYGDYYYVTIKGYLNGAYTNSVVYYLADYRSSTAYVVDEWKWVNLQGLGTVDSLAFELTTSDSGQYGPNTPMYFCLDEIKVGTCQSCATTDNTHNTFPTPGYSASRADAQDLKIEVSPNPVNSVLTVQTETGSNISILSKEGSVAKKLKATASSVDVPVSDLYPGMYIIHCENGGRTASTTFIKN